MGSDLRNLLWQRVPTRRNAFVRFLPATVVYNVISLVSRLARTMLFNEENTHTKQTQEEARFTPLHVSKPSLPQRSWLSASGRCRHHTKPAPVTTSLLKTHPLCPLRVYFTTKSAATFPPRWWRGLFGCERAPPTS